MAENAVSSGAALEKLRSMIKSQGGNTAVIEDYSLFKSAAVRREIVSDTDGYICGISCEETGMISLRLGAGRQTKDAVIDPAAGIVFDKTVGDSVKKGERLATLYTSSECGLDEIAADFAEVFRFGKKEELPKEKNIIKIIKGY